jgi:hypothetical protein
VDQSNSEGALKNLKLESLWTYPVKSCKGIQSDSLEITREGPKWDRHWMIVDENGVFLTQRQIPKMALIETMMTESSLVLRIDGTVFQVPLQAEDGPKRQVKIWKSEVEAYLEDELISNYLSEFLGKKVFLVRSIPEQRQFHIRFADSRPLQLANLDSLEAVNKKLSAPVTIERFRANIVISGVGAFAEDTWDEFEIGGMTFKVSKPCIRCSIINVEPTTGERPNNEPLTKLNEIHPIDGKPAFGILLLPKNAGTLAL